MTTPTNNWDLLAWLDEHRERGRLLKEDGRKIANQETAKAWHEREIGWRDELVATVKPLHSSWAADLLFLDDDFEKGRGEEKHLKYKEAKFVESAQFHAARLYTLRVFRQELRVKTGRKPGPKKKDMSKQIDLAKELRRSGAANSDREAAKMAIDELGYVNLSEKAAIDFIRKRISPLPRGFN